MPDRYGHIIFWETFGRFTCPDIDSSTFWTTICTLKSCDINFNSQNYYNMLKPWTYSVAHDYAHYYGMYIKGISAIILETEHWRGILHNFSSICNNPRHTVAIEIQLYFKPQVVTSNRLTWPWSTSCTSLRYQAPSKWRLWACMS